MTSPAPQSTLRITLIAGVTAAATTAVVYTILKHRERKLPPRPLRTLSSDQKNRMLTGLLYEAWDPLLMAERKYAHDVLAVFNASERWCNRPFRHHILTELLGRFPANAQIEPPFHADYGYNIKVGDNFFANFGCIFLDCAEITFGDNCMLAPGVQVLTATHPLDAQTRCKLGVEFAKKIVVGDNVWIGGGAIICPGVTIGNGVVVAAGAVVTKDVDDNCVVAGCPAMVKKRVQQ